jgi:hypothetical protein
VKALVNLPVPLNAGKVSSGKRIDGFSSSAQLRGVGYAEYTTVSSRKRRVGFSVLK